MPSSSVNGQHHPAVYIKFCIYSTLSTGRFLLQLEERMECIYIILMFYEFISMQEYLRTHCRLYKIFIIFEYEINTSNQAQIRKIHIALRKQFTMNIRDIYRGSRQYMVRKRYCQHWAGVEPGTVWFPRICDVTMPPKPHQDSLRWPDSNNQLLITTHFV